MLHRNPSKKFFDFSIDALLKNDSVRGKVRHDHVNFYGVSSSVTTFHNNNFDQNQLESDQIIDPSSPCKSSVAEDLESNTFSWLNCTRFKPPKLPHSRKKCVSKRHGRGPRIPFSTHQLTILEKAFSGSQYLSGDAIKRLADSLQLTETRVKIWFQNRRARYRREKSGGNTSTPPQLSYNEVSSSTLNTKSWKHSLVNSGGSCLGSPEKSKTTIPINMIPIPNNEKIGEDANMGVSVEMENEASYKHCGKQWIRYLINDLNLMVATGTLANIKNHDAC